MAAPQPYKSIFGTTAPSTMEAPGGQFLIRTTFYVDVAATIYGVRFYRDRTDPGNHIAVFIKRGSAGNRDGQRAVAMLRNPALQGTFGWNHKYVKPALPVAANEWWDLVMWCTGGIYYDIPAQLSAADFVSGHIHVPKDGSTDPFGIVTPNGAWNNGAVTFNPNTSLGGPLLGLDVLLLTHA